MSKYQSGITGYLSPLMPWLSNPLVTEICLTEPKQLWIEESQQFKQVKSIALDSDYLHYFSQIVARYNNKVLFSQQPLLSGELPDGSRIQLVIPPISKTIAFVIRKHTTLTSTLIDFERNNFFQSNNKPSLWKDELSNLYRTKCYYQFIQTAILARKNILIAGKTASGKTTFMNACLAAIPVHERILLLEDTQELKCSQPNQLRLLSNARLAIDMRQLLKACLRLRPDRILIGEIRGPEILDFLSACGTGHEGGIATIHAGSLPMVWMRLMQLYKQNNVPAMQDRDVLRELQLVVDVIVLMENTKEGRRLSNIYYKEVDYHHESPFSNIS